jgi:hypothetical protein
MLDLPITYRGVVYPWQCDHMGHMNVMWYVGKFDEATWQSLSMLGLTPSCPFPAQVFERARTLIVPGEEARNHPNEVGIR